MSTHKHAALTPAAPTRRQPLSELQKALLGKGLVAKRPRLGGRGLSAPRRVRDEEES